MSDYLERKNPFVTFMALLPRRIIRCPCAALSEARDLRCDIANKRNKTEMIFILAEALCILELSIFFDWIWNNKHFQNTHLFLYFYYYLYIKHAYWVNLRNQVNLQDCILRCDCTIFRSTVSRMSLMQIYKSAKCVCGNYRR